MDWGKFYVCGRGFYSRGFFFLNAICGLCETKEKLMSWVETPVVPPFARENMGEMGQ